LPNNKYPLNGSKTCCQGRVDSGCLITTGLFLIHALTASGIIRSSAQSPPPITFPARVLATYGPFLKYELQ